MYVVLYVVHHLLEKIYHLFQPTLDFTINRLVEIFGKRKEAGKNLALKEIKCSNCEDGLPAITWCVECEDSLCERCNDAHQ